jgi:acyl dehydratase
MKFLATFHLNGRYQVDRGVNAMSQPFRRKVPDRRKLPDKGDAADDTSRLMDRLESKIRHLPTSTSDKVANSFAPPDNLAHYLHFFNSESHQHQAFLRECLPLRVLYSQLRETLGDETFVGEWFDMSQDRIDQFATLTGDQQWIHTDPMRAENESPFKTTISQGFLTLALIPMLTNSGGSENSAYPEARMVVNFGLNKVHFPHPVKVGKRIRAITRVISLIPMKRGLEVVKEVTVEIENSTRLACVAEPIVRLYF